MNPGLWAFAGERSESFTLDVGKKAVRDLVARHFSGFCYRLTKEQGRILVFEKGSLKKDVYTTPLGSASSSGAAPARPAEGPSGSGKLHGVSQRMGGQVAPVVGEEPAGRPQHQVRTRPHRYFGAVARRQRRTDAGRVLLGGDQRSEQDQSNSGQRDGNRDRDPFPPVHLGPDVRAGHLKHSKGEERIPACRHKHKGRFKRVLARRFLHPEAFGTRILQWFRVPLYWELRAWVLLIVRHLGIGVKRRQSSNYPALGFPSRQRCPLESLDRSSLTAPL